jgi:hypothetical protein
MYSSIEVKPALLLSMSSPFFGAYAARNRPSRCLPTIWRPKNKRQIKNFSNNAMFL